MSKQNEMTPDKAREYAVLLAGIAELEALLRGGQGEMTLEEAVAVLNEARWRGREYRLDGASAFWRDPTGSNCWHLVTDYVTLIAIARSITAEARIAELQRENELLRKSHQEWLKLSEEPALIMRDAGWRSPKGVEAMQQENERLRAERSEIASVLGGTSKNYAIGALPIYLRPVLSDFHDLGEHHNRLRRAVEPVLDAIRQLGLVTLADWRELVAAFDGESEVEHVSQQG